MDTAHIFPWLLAGTLAVAAVLIPIALARLIDGDGYGRTPAADPRDDWGTPSTPSRPYSTRV